MAFLDERISDEISRNAVFSKARRIVVITSRNGHEHRNELWEGAKREYLIAFGTRDIGLIQQLSAFHERVGGQRDGFRLKDWFDHTSSADPTIPITDADQTLEPILDDPASGTAHRWQIVKRYGSVIREITKPVDGTVRIRGHSTGFAINHLTGIITFDNPIPISPAPTCGFEFDVPVRFADDALDVEIGYIENAAVPEVTLIELFGDQT